MCDVGRLKTSTNVRANGIVVQMPPFSDSLTPITKRMFMEIEWTSGEAGAIIQRPTIAGRAWIRTAAGTASHDDFRYQTNGITNMAMNLPGTRIRRIARGARDRRHRRSHDFRVDVGTRAQRARCGVSRVAFARPPPEQYRIAGIRHSIRLVSTPACRAARAVSDPRYDAVDHVMTYFFADGAAFDQFNALSAALGGDRRPFRLPSVSAGYFRLAGKVAARRAIAGADVMPWRPARGVYLIVEQGAQSPADLVDVAGVAGIWWHEGGASACARLSRTTAECR